MLQNALQDMPFFSVMGAVQEKMFDCFDCNALAMRTRQRFRLMDAKKMMVEANMSRSKLKED